MLTARSATLPLLALLAATPVWLPISRPPVVTAMAELWTVAMAGLVTLFLGAQAWRAAPLQVAAFETPETRRSAWPRLLVLAAAIAGLLSAFIGLVQVLAPEVLQPGTGPVAHLIQPSHLSGRAVGHLRQPNHLATVLLWGLVAWAGMHARWRIPLGPAAVGWALLVSALVFTGSRTGLLGTLLLAGWGAIDRRLPRHTRAGLALTPVLAALVWWALQAWGTHRGVEFGAPQHLASAGGGDVSSSRFAIWRDSWTLIMQQPWSGVGWGQFNFAWTLTPLPDRPVAFFGNAHNLPLHLLVELGVPWGLAACGALCALLVWAARRAWAADEGDPADEAVARRGAVAMLAIVALHSLLEYPLWYAYLGLPALLALVVALGLDKPATRAARWQALLWMVIGTSLLSVAAWAWRDYRVISDIYAPRPGAPSLAERIERGQEATWFADQAHYALATTVKPVAGEAWTHATARAFERAPHVLLDSRLMMAWADALATRDGPGDRDRARYIAARLREFRSPAAQDWLDACKDAGAPPRRRFVCETPEQISDWRAFSQP